ncbi:MAG: response regulator transcription factor [Flavisolibacter sp.]|nr:response regulator transcription factor [Flavisolibacter sp.]
MQKIRIGIVDDHQVVINGLTTMLSNFGHLSVVYTASESNAVLQQLETVSVDLLMMDIQMPGIDGIELTRQIRKHFPAIKVLAFSSFENSHYVKNAMRNGALGYLLKNADHQTILEAITKLMEGEMYIDRKVEKIMLKESITGERRSSFEVVLTKRESEILKLIVEEYSNQQIADKLFISLRTVEAHRFNLTQKLGIKNLAGLTKEAQRRGLLE